MSAAAPASGPTARRRPVILAVDDDQAVLAAVRADLRGRYGHDHRVIAVDGGAQAITTLGQMAVRGDEVAVVVCDQRMPDITGVDVLREASRLFEGVRTVLLTAYADTDVAIDAINDLHLDYYILKPWDPPEERLFPVIDDLLGDWHAAHPPVQQLTRVVGSRWSQATHLVRDFLQRSQIPMVWLDVDTDKQARMLRSAAGDGELPLVITPDGTQLSAPGIPELAAALGHPAPSDAQTFDLAIVGAGPAGLAAAVYGASEGLRTVCIEQMVAGGQAGQSSRIENYLGFPNGIAGADLARRALTQARRFLVDVMAPQTVAAVDVSGPYPQLTLAGGQTVSCGALILACGVSYRSLDVPGSDRFEGRGVYYGAALSERDTVAGEDIVVVGGANSAGQAAVFFSAFARSVTILCRATQLGAKMSQYLVDQIAVLPNVTVECGTVVREVAGADHLEQVTVDAVSGGDERILAATSLFVFIGASPRTDWLPPQIVRDERGFVVTGSGLGTQRHRTADGERDPFLYETSVARVFAVGDVRAQSVKRVASAVGEGSVAVQFVHRVLHE